MNVQLANLKFKKLKKRKSTEMIVYHHADHASCSIYDIHCWHLKNGWSGIGYHYFITKEGIVYQGRPEDMVGAHCRYHNSNSLGICVQGDYENQVMPEKQYLALINLSKFLMRKYGIDLFVGHGEVNDTSCPGKLFPIQELRNELLKNEVYDTYTIKEGDTIESISKEIGLSIEEIVNINQLAVGNIQVNQILKIK